MLEKILKIFYNDVTGVFTINELAKKTKVSYSYVYSQVEDLQKRGIIIVDKQSNRKCCKPNYNNPEVKTAFVKISNEISSEFL